MNLRRKNSTVPLLPVQTWGFLSALFSLVIAASAFAPTAYALTRQHTTTDQDLRPGMVAALSADGSVSVQRATQAAATRTVGIVIHPSTDTLTVTGATSSNISNQVSDIDAEGVTQVLIASTGEAKAYVSDINGAPQIGDLLAPSPLRGILMRATDDTPGIVGIALQDFDPDSTETISLTRDNGTNQDTTVSIINISMDAKTTTKPGALGFLQRLGQSLTGRPVSATQFLIAIIILVLVILSSAGILYASISSYLTSLGRNPLAKAVLRRGLINAVGMVLAVVVVGTLSAYGVLWL